MSSEALRLNLHEIQDGIVSSQDAIAERKTTEKDVDFVLARACLRAALSPHNKIGEMFNGWGNAEVRDPRLSIAPAGSKDEKVVLRPLSDYKKRLQRLEPIDEMWKVKELLQIIFDVTRVLETHFRNHTKERIEVLLEMRKLLNKFTCFNPAGGSGKVYR